MKDWIKAILFSLWITGSIIFAIYYIAKLVAEGKL